LKVKYTCPDIQYATVRNQNFIREEIKSRSNSEIACYNSVQKLFSSRLLFKNLKIKIYKTTILPVVLYGCETWSLRLKKEQIEVAREKDAKDNIMT
jgi:hypothetical protein